MIYIPWFRNYIIAMRLKGVMIIVVRVMCLKYTILLQAQGLIYVIGELQRYESQAVDLGW